MKSMSRQERRAMERAIVKSHLSKPDRRRLSEMKLSRSKTKRTMYRQIVNAILNQATGS